MTYYQRGPEFREVAQLVKEFQTRLKRLRNSRQADPQEREAMVALSREILAGLREERTNQVEQAQQKHLTREFQQLLQETLLLRMLRQVALVRTRIRRRLRNKVLLNIRNLIWKHCRHSLINLNLRWRKG